jgi:two-component system response regulator FixJ
MVDLDQCRREQAVTGCEMVLARFSGPKGLSMTEIEQRRVAIVDDDQAVRESLKFLLEIIGRAVETFASAAEFLKAEQQHLACLILDHHMPEMTGLELVERLRAGGSGIPILLITGLPSPAIATRAAELGIRVLDKPLTEGDLLDFIDGTRS